MKEMIENYCRQFVGLNQVPEDRSAAESGSWAAMSALGNKQGNSSQELQGRLIFNQRVSFSSCEDHRNPRILSSKISSAGSKDMPLRHREPIIPVPRNFTTN